MSRHNNLINLEMSDRIVAYCRQNFNGRSPQCENCHVVSNRLQSGNRNARIAAESDSSRLKL